MLMMISLGLNAVVLVTYGRLDELSRSIQALLPEAKSAEPEPGGPDA